MYSRVLIAAFLQPCRWMAGTLFTKGNYISNLWRKQRPLNGSWRKWQPQLIMSDFTCEQVTSWLPSLKTSELQADMHGMRKIHQTNHPNRCMFFPVAAGCGLVGLWPPVMETTRQSGRGRSSRFTFTYDLKEEGGGMKAIHSVQKAPIQQVTQNSFSKEYIYLKVWHKNNHKEKKENKQKLMHLSFSFLMNPLFAVLQAETWSSLDVSDG